MTLTEIDFKSLKLPVQPQALAAIMQLDDHTDMNFQELDKLIRVDQAISASILKMANSSFYARGNKIASLQQAIALLGFKLIRSMVVLLTTKSLFDAGKYEKFRTHVHKHSIAAAITAKNLAIDLGLKHMQEEAFVAGLLHDIGKVIMNVQDRQKFIESLNICIEKQIPAKLAEQQLFGYDHTQVGKIAAETWKLPEIFIQIIADHETETFAAPADDVARVVLIVEYADFIAKKAGYGFMDTEAEARAGEIAFALGLSAAQRDQFEKNQKEQMDADPFFKYCTGLMS